MERRWKSLIPAVVVLSAVVLLVSSKPVKQKPHTAAPPSQDANGSNPNKETGLEYDRYLQQVVEALESDSEFSKKLEAANVSEIKSGAIASHLQMVNRSIRTKLDEIKRMEVTRLQQLARLKSKAANNGPGGRLNRMEIPDHLDLRNPHSFEVKDLENLIMKTLRDLEEVDNKRREDFKQYEMEKEFEYQQKLKDLPQEEQQQLKAKHEQLQKKHQEHEKIQHPGSKDQFNEVWEKDDKMEDQDFDPKTFFMMHDLNNDMFWDIQEVEAVLQNELEKVYDSKNSPEEDDPVEKMEEMNRMREHVFTDIDKDRDLMISIQEFLEYTGKHGENDKFKENDGWKTVDEDRPFTDEEYQQYLREHHAQPGVVPPPVDDGHLEFKPEQELHQQQQQEQVAQQGMPQAVPADQQQQQHHLPQDSITQGVQQQQEQQQEHHQQQQHQQQQHQQQEQHQQEQHHQQQQQEQLNVVQQGQEVPVAQEAAPQHHEQQQQQQQVPLDGFVGQQGRPMEAQHPQQLNEPGQEQPVAQ